MRFFAAVAARKQNDDLAIQIFRFRGQARLKSLMDAVGDDIAVCFSSMMFKDLANKLGRIVNRVDIAVEDAIKKFIGQQIGDRHIHHENMIGEVFGLDMKTGRDRLS